MNSYDQLEQQLAAFRATPQGRDFLSRVDEAVGDLASGHDVTVEHVAATMCVTSSTLRRHLRRRAGVTPSRYLMQLRLRRAVELFARADQLPIAAVAEACGFYDHSHMTRSFLRYMGVTPKAYLQSLEQGRSLE